MPNALHSGATLADVLCDRPETVTVTGQRFGCVLPALWLALEGVQVRMDVVCQSRDIKGGTIT